MNTKIIRKLTEIIKEELEREIGLFTITKEGSLQTKEAEYNVFFDEDGTVVLKQI